MRILFLLASLYCLVGHSNPLRGQNGEFNKFPIQFFNDEIAPTRYWKDDALSSINVKCALKDEAFIWIGTGDGLSRFDGRNFINFSKHKEQPASGIKSVNRIVKSSAGFFWVCHSQGISKFDPNTFAVQYYNPIEPESWGKDKVAVYNLIETARGEVYATTYWGLAKYRPEYDDFVVTQTDTIGFKSQPYHITKKGPIMEDVELGGIWFSSYRYLCFYDYGTKTYFSVLNNPKNWAIFNKGIEPNEVCGMLKDSQGHYWFSVRRVAFLFKFDAIKNTLTNYPIYEPRKQDRRIIEPQANEIIQINESEIAFCPESGGMLIFDIFSNNIKRVYYKLESVHRVPFMPIVNEIEVLDEKWVSIATDNGWYLQRCFNFIEDIVHMERPLGKGAYSQLYKGAENRIWIRSNKHQLQRFDTQSRTYRQISMDTDTTIFDEYYNIYPSHNKCFFTNTSSGIKKIDTKTSNLSQLVLSNYKLNASHIIYGAYKDSLYFISKRGSDSVLIINNKNSVIGKVPYPNSATQLLSQVFMDSKFRIWASYELWGGVWVQKSRNDVPVSFQQNAKHGHFFKAERFGRFFEDGDGKIWTVTDGPGILVISQDLKDVYKYRLLDRMKNVSVWAVDFIDSNLALLASKTDFLLYKIKEQKGISGDYRRFFNGYPMFSHPLRKDGKLYMTSYDDLYTFDFKKMSEATLPDSPFVAAIISNKRLYALRDLRAGLVLRQDETDLEIQFADMHTFDVAGNQFWSYRIKGVSDEWKSVVYRKAFINNLEYGTYTLELLRIGPDIVNGEVKEIVTDSIKISVLPYWYQTWWFRTLVCLAAAALIWWLFQQNTLRKLAAQRAEIEQQQALERERERIARDMHDDLGSGLSAIHLLSNFAKDKASDPAVRSEMEKIAASSANLNQNIREIIWTVNSADDTLPSLSHFLRRYCADFQENTGLVVQFDTPFVLPETTLSGELRRNLFLCIKEALNNAAKYAKASKVKVKLESNKNQIVITVLDNGIGFDVENALNNGGNGLKNMQHRMQVIGGTTTFESQNGTTELRFEVKV